jgi:spermidine synthase
MSKRRPVREKREKKAAADAPSSPASADDAEQIAEPEKKTAAPADPKPLWIARGEFAFAHAAAFVSGGCLMIMELVASRVLAPAFGNSVYLWTSVIGLILAALSAGYYGGGIVADRWPHLRTLSWALTGSGVAVAIVPIIAPTIIAAFSGDSGPIEGPVLATTFLFLIPGIVIGACSPIAVKLVAVGGAQVGHASGRVSALGALGSILGTFAAGFYLIQIAGNQAILIGVAIALAVLGAVGFALARAKPAAPGGAVVATAALCLLGTQVSASEPAAEGMRLRFEQQTFYHRVRVEDEIDRPVRHLLLDSTAEGAMVINEPDILHYNYTQYLDVAPVFVANARRAAFIGGGSFAMPKHFVSLNPANLATVYEIDPVVVDVGREYFDLDEYPRVTASVGDARQNLRRRNERYDIIFGDAYNGVRAIPTHLASLEYYTLVRDQLTLGGVYMSNVISPLAGDGAGFFLATARTLLQVFPELYVFARGVDRTNSTNVIIVCPRSPLGLTPAEIRDLGRQLGVEHLTGAVVDLESFQSAIDAAPLLTDDFNPAQVLVATQGDE